MKMRGKNPTKGVGLIIVILVIAFLLAIGLVVITVTSTGPAVAGNIRLQQQAFNAAEAGFDAALRAITDNLGGGAFVDFGGQYRTTYNGQPGIDNPDSNPATNPNYLNYFRRLTDRELVQDALSHTPKDTYIFASQPMPDDSRFSYTVFLIDDEAGGGTADDMDAILVCIGQGPQNTYARLEIEIAIQSQT
jgi:hypothetical protein